MPPLPGPPPQIPTSDPRPKPRTRLGDVAMLFLVGLGVVASIMIPVAACQICDPLDSYPYLLCLTVGVLISAATIRWGSILGTGAFFVILGAPIWSMAVGIAANELADRSPAVAHQTTFVGYDWSRKGPARAKFVSWRGARESRPAHIERFICSDMTARGCDDLTKGTEVVVWTRAGALGWEWIERVEPR